MRIIPQEDNLNQWVLLSYQKAQKLPSLNQQSDKTWHEDYLQGQLSDQKAQKLLLPKQQTEKQAIIQWRKNQRGCSTKYHSAEQLSDS